MSTYTAPLKDMLFAINEIAGLAAINQLPGNEDATPDLVEAVLEEASKFAGGVLAPINWPGDREGAHWKDKAVTTPAGFKPAYRQFVDGGWNGLSCSPEHGGQGMPKILAAAVNEMWRSANLAFALCPMLTNGAIEALELSGSAVQKSTYLPKMVAGEWTGTMNLTEPQAGSDLAAIRTRAVPQGDGTYRVFGQKIFITYGDHDFTENTIHLVLARTPDAPEGVKGISMFVVPKFLVNDDGSLGARNDAYCVSIEHKLGIHASPTCVMAFGDGEGAIGTLVGKENEGLKYMFIMMNAARFGVGLEGLALGEAAYQKAASFARDRVQGRAIEGSPAPVAIVQHPDVRRMLMDMRSHTEAMRALAYWVAGQNDIATRHPDDAERKRSQNLVDLLIPIVKGWSTEVGNALTYTGVQVHGGMGFVEETGAAQFMRDARITTIYEGTTGIQANDLIGRKIARDGGATMNLLLESMRVTESELVRHQNASLQHVGLSLARAVDALAAGSKYIVANFGTDVRAVALGAVPFLHLLGTVAGGWVMARSALVAQSKIDDGETDTFFAAKLVTARYYTDHAMTRATGLAEEVVAGGASGLALADELF